MRVRLEEGMLYVVISFLSDDLAGLVVWTATGFERTPLRGEREARWGWGRKGCTGGVSRVYGEGATRSSSGNAAH